MHQDGFEVTDMISIRKGPARVGEYRAQITSIGLEKEEQAWGSVSTIYVDAPKY